jgi:alanine or glycine:cation symporter, AGCS family
VVFAVIVGGIRSIAKVTSRLVPLMGVVYVAGALLVLAANADQIVWAFGQILEGAFTGLGVAGGMVGALIMGFRRAAFSNEAGLGSAAIAHAAVRTNEPVSEGTVALLEPFIDTVVICTLTALVIIVSGVLVFDAEAGRYVLDGGRIATKGDAEGVALTSAAFATVVGWFPYVLALAVVLFAISTMITWAYYGLKAWTFLFGEGQRTEMAFKLGYCGFIVIGAAAQLGAVIDFSDAMIFSMAVFNIIALYALMPVVRAEARSYFARLKSGEVAPVGRKGRR